MTERYDEPIEALKPGALAKSANEEPVTRCAHDACSQITKQPYLDGWVKLSGWGPPVKDGFYYPEHASVVPVLF